MSAHMAAMLFPTAAVTLFLQRPTIRYALGADEAKPGAAMSAGRAPRPIIGGRILDAWGNPVPHASVYVVGAQSHELAGRTETRSDGTFQIDPPDAPKAARLDGKDDTNVRVVAEADAGGYVESAELGIEEARHVVLVLEQARTVAGVVLDERGVPVPHATVKSGGQGVVLEKIAITDDEGRYEIRRLPRSADRLSIWARGFETATQRLLPTDPDSMRRDVRLAPAPAIRGTVVDALGHPVEGAQITACEEKELERAISGRGGAFSLPATTAGCAASASHPRFATSRATLVERALTIRLGTGGAIEGIAVDDLDKPVGAFTLTIESFEPADGETSSSTRAGESHDELRGQFRLDDLAPGTYVISASAEGYTPAQSEAVEVLRGKVVRGIQIQLGRPGAAPLEEPPAEEVAAPVEAPEAPAEDAPRTDRRRQELVAVPAEEE